MTIIIKEITAIRNKMLYPDGVPFEFGCDVKWNNNIYTIQAFGGISADPDFDKNCVQITNFKPYGEAYPLMNEIVNLGKPVSIVDILRMLPEDETIEVFKQKELNIIKGSRHNRIDIDLTKGDYIKDQDEDIQKEILKLIKL